jgi:polysaccharide biosynthesis transport protein
LIRHNLPVEAPEPIYTLPAAGGDEESPAGGMSVAQVICILRAHWKYSAIILVTLTVLIGIGIKLMPKVFVAQATLIVNYEDKDPLAGRDFATGAGATFVPTQIELILSRVVLQPVVTKLQLTTDKEYARGFHGTPEALNEIVTKNLQNSLIVQPGAGSQLLYVSASAKSPERAAQIANAVTDEYLRQQQLRTNEPAAERAERYSQELAELRLKVISAQDRVTEFRQQSGMTEVDPEKNDQEGAALTDLQQKLQDAQNQRRQLQSRQVNARSTSDAVLDSSAVQGLRAGLAVQEAQMGKLRATLGPKHPQVLELESQMAATRRSLDEAVQSISASDSVQLQRARDLEARYQAAVDTERARLMARRGVQDQGSKLVLELQSAQATYKKALDGYDQIVFASAGNYRDVSLVSRADPPAKPEKPNKMKLFMMGCVMSLILALAGPFGYELLLNRRLRCRDDLERHFGIPVLAQFGPMPSPGT